MNSKEFLRTLRTIIREEVQDTVRAELKKFQSVITESKSTKVPATKYVDTYKPAPKSTQQKKQFVKDSLLNDLLNETSGFSGTGPMAYLDEQIDYNDQTEWPTMNASIAPRVPQVMVDNTGRAVNMKELAQTEAGAAVVDALTKDYSALMKAIDKKKGK